MTVLLIASAGHLMHSKLPTGVPNGVTRQLKFDALRRPDILAC